MPATIDETYRNQSAEADGGTAAEPAVQEPADKRPLKAAAAQSLSEDNSDASVAALLAKYLPGGER